MSLEQQIAELTDAVKQLTAAILSQKPTQGEDANQLKLPIEESKGTLCNCNNVSAHIVEEKQPEKPKTISVEDIRQVVVSQGISNTKIVDVLKTFGVQNLTALDANKRADFLTKLCS